jgi:UDP-glucose 6-dehydrogenase
MLHVCYPFDLPVGFIDITASYADKFRPEMIVIHSTVRPGTSREVASRTRLPVVYSPVRGKHARMQEELLHYCKMVAGTEAVASQRAREFFVAVGMKSEVFSIPEALELAKLLETTYFGLLIAWAQEMDRFARQMGADYMELTRFFEEIDYLPRHVFLPGHIGGHCVMPNIDILKERVQAPMLDAIVDSNQRKAKELGAQAGSRAQQVTPIAMNQVDTSQKSS